MKITWNTLITLWKLLDGKKTAIGWFFGILTSAPFIPNTWDETLMWFAYVFGGIGVAHKVTKGDNTTPKT